MKDESCSNSKAVNVQWFPGHMARAKRKLAEDIKLVDAVAEIRDARCPLASENADIADITSSRPHLVILNRADLADLSATRLWVDYLKSHALAVMTADSKSGKGISAFASAARELLRDKIERNSVKGITAPMRFIVVGIPNVGKSTFINRLAGRNAAVSADRPGVTRGKQWISAGKGIELLDTPGILPPKLTAGETLAYTGAVRDDILDVESIAASLMRFLANNYPKALNDRYKLEAEAVMKSENPLEMLARRRGFIITGGSPDTLRAANVLLDEFRAGKMGRITLERPEGFSVRS